MNLLEYNSHKTEYTCEYCKESNFELTYISRILPVRTHIYKSGVGYTGHSSVYEEVIKAYTKMAVCNWCNTDIVVYFDYIRYGSYQAKIEHDPSVRGTTLCKYQKMLGHFRPWNVVAKKITIPPYVNHGFNSYLCSKHPFVQHGFNADTYVSHREFISSRFSKTE